MRIEDQDITFAAPNALVAMPDAIRQLVVFPPDGIARRSGLVRERFLLIELANGCVYHVRVPCDWLLSGNHMGKLAEMIADREVVGACDDQSASVIGWALETPLQFVDLDLASLTVDGWPIRAAAMELVMFSEYRADSPALIMQRVAKVQRGLCDAAATALKEFVNKLNSDIISLTYLWGEMPWSRYNYFAKARTDKVRHYRLQAAAAMPALVTILCSESTPLSKTLFEVVDTGKPLALALAAACQVRQVTAKHALCLPPAYVEGGGLLTLTRSLDALIPDRFPREVNEWNVFRRLALEVIPSVTGRTPMSPLNRSILAAISCRGWQQAERQLSRLCVTDDSALLLRGFLHAYRKALSWAIIHNGAASQEFADTLSADVVEAALARVGIQHLFEAARSYPALLRDAQTELVQYHDVQRGQRWNCIIKEPMTLHGCTIAPVTTFAQLVKIGRDLANCLPSYTHYCAEGRAHVFSVHGSLGEVLGAVGIQFFPDKEGHFEAKVFDCKGPRNEAMCELGTGAVAAFLVWLKTREAQDQIAESRRAQFSRWRGKKKEIEERIEIDSSIAALQKLRHKALRFEALCEQITRKAAKI